MQGKEAGQQTIACSREELLEEESITALTRAASSMPHPLGKPSLWRCGGYLAYLFSHLPFSRNEQHEQHAV